MDFECDDGDGGIDGGYGGMDFCGGGGKCIDSDGGSFAGDLDMSDG